MENIHTLFEAQVRNAPAHVAVDAAHEQLTYRELNGRANYLARVLDRAGAAPGVIVGVWLPPGAGLVTALLATCKAGAIYMPMGAGFSRKRLRQIFEATFPRVLVTGAAERPVVEAMLADLGAAPDCLVVLEADGSTSLAYYRQGRAETTPADPGLSRENLGRTIDPGAGSYLFYTSGSTGEGKAILGNNRALCHFIGWEIRELGIDAGHRISQLAQVTFDASFKDIFTALCGGATLCVPTQEIKDNAARLVAWLHGRRLTVLQCVPSIFRVILKAVAGEAKPAGGWFPELRHVLLAGEMLYARDLLRWREAVGDHAEIINLYGATESTILKTCHRVREVPANPAQIIHVGKPIDDTAVAVINDNHLCRPGEKGEVYIRTAYLTNGYVGNEALNAAAFVQNPLVNGRRDIVYRTGDVGRLLKDGSLEILGRADKQVKVNGVRVELGEVEGAVLGVPGIDEAVVVPHCNADGQTELVCYYTNPAVTAAGIRAHLAAELNQGMAPTHLIRLDRFPLNSNGKVNRAALPSPEAVADTVPPGEEPLTETERRLAPLWREALGGRHVARSTSFFHTGGNSLKAIQLTALIYKTFGVNVKLAEVFAAPTLAGLAKTVAAAAPGVFVPILPTEEQEDYDLSHGQSRLWALAQLEADKAAYNMHGAYTLTGPFDRTAFEKALEGLLDRHESLRTVFFERHGRPRQKITPPAARRLPLTYADLRGCQDVEELARKIAYDTVSHPFNLWKGPLVRFTLLHTGEQQHVLLCVMHHIIADGWSTEVLLREVTAAYNACRAGEAPAPPALAVQYRDYVAWQQRQLRGTALEDLRRYWHGQFAGELPVLDLPGTKPRPAVKTYRGRRISFRLDKDLSGALGAYGRQQEASLFMVLLAGVKHLLYLYTGQKDLVVGTPTAGRDHHDLHDQIGFFINNLALRTRLSGGDSFGTLLDKVKTVATGAYAHQSYPFHYLVNDLQVPRDPSRSLLYDVGFTWHGVAGRESAGAAGFALAQFDTGFVAARADLWFHGMETPEGIRFFCEYNTDLLTEEWVARLTGHFTRLLAWVMQHPGAALPAAAYLSPGEYRRQLAAVNPGDGSDGLPACVARFEAVAAAHPDREAVVCGARRLTYAALNRQANQLAAYLRETWRVAPDDLVGLLADHSERMIVAVLGILKAGAAFLPIEPTTPAGRISLMLNDARPKGLLTESDLLPAVAGTFSGEIFALDLQLELLDTPAENPAGGALPGNLAYVMYTSGSTGRPKGVAVTVGNLTSYLDWAGGQYFGGPGGHTFGLFTPLSFDLTVTSLFAPLLRGDRLVVCPQRELDERLLYAFGPESTIDALKLTPAHLDLLRHLPLRHTAVRTVIVGGEVLAGRHVAVLRQLNPGVRIYNEYGPTETTVGCTAKEVRLPGDTATVGRPAAHARLYVTGEGQHLLPPGFPGEICVGGPGVARGYLNDPALTAGKFVRLPATGERIYRTGDLGKWSPDGELVFLGRADNQLKIRGHRIEPAEVERVLGEHPAVAEALALPLTEAGEVRLVAYVTGPAAAVDFGPFLKAHLPDYLVPSRVVVVPAFPLTPHGKVDHRALAALAGAPAAPATVAPRTATEQRLLGIWREVLGKDSISVKDNFFTLGGHSLKAIQAVYLIHQACEVKLKPSDLFAEPTLEGLAALVDAAAKTAFAGLVQVEEQEHYPVSHAQRRLWLFDQMAGAHRNAYHIPTLYEFRGEVDAAAFAKALRLVTERHESLRTGFVAVNGQPRQKVREASALRGLFGYADCRTEEDQAAIVKAYQTEMAAAPFDLEKGPLLRGKLIRLGEAHYLFLFTIHHIISDEWSFELLTGELLSVYRALREGEAVRPAPLAVQYKDYAVWQKGQLVGDALAGHRDYWHDQLRESIPPVDLPIARQRPKVRTYRGDRIDFQLGRELTGRVRELSAATGASVFMVLLAALKTLVYRYTSQPDLVVSTPGAGREHPDLEDQIGNYVNLLPIRTHLDGSRPFGDALDRVRTATLGAYDHQVYPFDRMAEDLKPQPDKSRSVLFDLGFTWHSRQMVSRAADPGDPGFTVKQLLTEFVSAKADLWFHAVEHADDVAFSLVYATDLFEVHALERFTTHYRTLLDAVLREPGLPVNEQAFIPEAEKQAILRQSVGEALAYAGPATVQGLFEAQAARTPDAVAVVFHDKAFTYRQLNQKANQLAAYLRDKRGVQPGDLVGVIVNRSELIPVCLLGVMKAGGVYLPSDPENPFERLTYILENSRAKLLITQSDLLIQVMDYYQGPLLVADMELEPGGGRAGNPVSVNGGDDPAYVIYTSGTTGKPKGAAVMHRNLLNLLAGLKSTFPFSPAWQYILASSISFDSSIKQMLVPLTLGGALHVLDNRRDIRALTDYLRRRRIHAMSTTPSVLQAVLAEIKNSGPVTSLRYISAGGEQLSGGLAARLRENFPDTLLVNVYGPTETTDLALVYPLPRKPHEDPPIGSPLPNCEVYLLDERQQLLPQGVKGEICIGGHGVSMGYLHNPALNAQKFVPHPFRKGEKIYRTGDIAVRGEDGQVRFLGRVDRQVKIRGHRVEMGEVEKTLLQHRDVEKCVVNPTGEGADKEIVAYFTRRERVTLRPSWAEQFAYDDMAYYAMSNDHFRNQKYRNALQRAVKDKVVLEVGPGSEAVLSVMCIACGARKVYAVEIFEEAYHKARKRVALLGLQDRIEVIHGDVARVTLPEKADCCVSEIVGSIGGSQGAARIMNAVRPLLNDPRQMIPARSVSRIAAVTLPDDEFAYELDEVGAHYAEKIFRSAGGPFDLRLCLQHLQVKHLVSSEAVFEALDYREENALEGEHDLALTVSRSAVVHGLAVWLCLHIDDREVIDTFRDREQNLWLPVYLPVFGAGVAVKRGDVIRARVTRTLSRDGVHPDYALAGVLHRAGAPELPFSYASFNQEAVYKSNHFYQQLFSEDRLRVSSGADKAGIREYLGKFLPPYMLPAYLVELEAIPLTVHGKVDYKALPEPGETDFARRTAFEQPRNRTEARLLQLWQEVLRRDQISTGDTFFAAGGHSLRAAQLIGAVHAAFGVTLDLKELFANPTLAEMAARIAAAARQEQPGVRPVEEQEHYAVSHAQKRLWLLHQTREGLNTYNSPVSLQLGGSFRPEAFAEAFAALTVRHDSLRTVFITAGGVPRQKVLPAAGFANEVAYADVQYQPDREERLRQMTDAHGQLPFRLEEGPLVRIKLVHRGQGNYLLLFNMHHIIGDAWSMRVLLDELMHLYRAYAGTGRPSLPPLTVQYKDFTAWQYRQLAGENLLRHQAYWAAQFADGAPVLDLPTDFARGAAPGSGGGSVTFALDPALSGRLRTYAGEQNATLFMGLLALVNALLYKYTAQTDIVTGTNVAGRDHPDLRHQIGFYLNTLPLRVRFDEKEGYAALLASARETALGAFTHQLYPFDLLVSRLNLAQDRSRSPLFDVEVELLNVEAEAGEGTAPEEVTARGYDNGFSSSKDDLSFRFCETGGGLRLSIRFRTDLFETATIERMGRHFVEITRAALAGPHVPLAELEYYTPEEKEQIMSLFNDGG